MLSTQIDLPEVMIERAGQSLAYIDHHIPKLILQAGSLHRDTQIQIDPKEDFVDNFYCKMS